MSVKIEHQLYVTDTYAITSDPLTSGRVSYAAAGGGIMLPTGVTGTPTITWYVSATAVSTPVPIQEAGANVTTAINSTGGNKAYYVPDALFAAAFVIPVLSTGTCSATFMLKG
jgi:hypothetical protein